jgi:hypothetical protein
VYLVAKTVDERVAAPTPRRSDREGILVISIKRDYIKSIMGNERL